MPRATARGWPDVRRLHTIVFDFDGVFTDNTVYVFQDGREAVRCDRGDGLAIGMLQRYSRRAGLDMRLLVLSTERNRVVAARARKLRLDCRQGVGDKLEFLDGYLRRTRRGGRDPFDRLLYLGNDLNDLALIQRAGFSVVPHDAHPTVRRRAAAVLPYAGGQGFVRAFVERLLGVNAMTVEELCELVSDR